MSFKASAPGSLMLLGEYAVLYGKPALVCAVDKRITVKLTPRKDNVVHIESDLHGQYETTLPQLKIEKPFQFVLAALLQYQSKLRNGCDIVITSNFSDQIGLGSSASVTVATLAALSLWLNTKTLSLSELSRQGKNVVRAVQGVGSGADIAASVYGGMVGYMADPQKVEPLAVTHPLSLFYIGFKTPTKDAIAQVEKRFAHHPALFRHILNAIGECAKEGIQFARQKSWDKFGEIMTIQQGLMEALGVSLPVIRKTIDVLNEQPFLGVKISGSGLGDCIVGLGEIVREFDFPEKSIERIDVAMTTTGVICEKV